ncbi:MAG: hypothetical protein O3B74_11530, partial [Proteobacteria bacterium]|nr:hypothetical protein [Pseudomonadota bacterium]
KYGNPSRVSLSANWYQQEGVERCHWGFGHVAVTAFQARDPTGSAEICEYGASIICCVAAIDRARIGRGKICDWKTKSLY